MFSVGQEVECIDVEGNLFLERAIPHNLIKGKIYIVEAVGLTNVCDPQKLPCILVNGPKHPVWAHRFRPIQKKTTDISSLIALLNPVNHKKLEDV